MPLFRDESKLIKLDSLTLPSTMQKAVEVIKKGGLLIFPTDTVYGLGCSAFHEPGLERIFALKKRSRQKPLPVLVNSSDQLADLISGEIPVLARRLIQKFWPGALTLIFPAGEQVPDLITAESKTIGVRRPNCPLILDLITASGVPLAATSVNLSGEASARQMSGLIAEWSPQVDLILDAGPLPERLASTVFDLTTHQILREGAVSARRLQDYLKPVPAADQKTTR